MEEKFTKKSGDNDSELMYEEAHLQITYYYSMIESIISNITQ